MSGSKESAGDTGKPHEVRVKYRGDTHVFRYDHASAVRCLDDIYAASKEGKFPLKYALAPAITIHAQVRKDYDRLRSTYALGENQQEIRQAARQLLDVAGALDCLRNFAANT